MLSIHSQVVKMLKSYRVGTYPRMIGSVLAWMNYALGDKLWMVPVARKDFKRGHNQGTVEKEPMVKRYEEGGRNFQANLVHWSEIKTVWALCEACSGDAHRKGVAWPFGQPSQRGWLSLQVRVSCVNRLSCLQHMWKLNQKIILRNRRQGLTYFKLRNC